MQTPAFGVTLASGSETSAEYFPARQAVVRRRSGKEAVERLPEEAPDHDHDAGERDLGAEESGAGFRAEYLYSTGRLEAIRFHFTNGEQADFERWARGFRPRVERNRVSWSQSAPGDTSHSSLRQFLDVVFEYAGTFSLSRELAAVRDVDEMKIGDVFIQGGFPGHAAVVVDMAGRRDTGKKVFLLAQSFMPAQDVHILKNPNDPALSPWYALDFEGELRTPE